MSQVVAKAASAHAGYPKRCPTCADAHRADALFCPSCGSALVMAQDALDGSGNDLTDPYIGTEILGHIDVRQLVGIGAMGRVYRGHQRGIDRDVAIKILRREISGNEQLSSRFTREAKVASKLSHPNVVQVHLAGELPDGANYIVMEFLDGLSLQSVLAAAGGTPLPLERTIHIAVQLCDAVGEAHAQGVVHRDLKPENVMLIQRSGDANFVKVLDFGIARMRASELSVSTAAGLIFGTARYISPEGAQGEKVTPASDVYSLAVVFYQLLTGKTPFEAEQPIALLLQHIHEPPPPLRAPKGRSIPDGIARAIMKNLAKDPTMRDADGRAFGRALAGAAREAGIVPDAPPRDSWSSPLTLPLKEAREGSAAKGLDDIARAGRTTKWTPPAAFESQLATATKTVATANTLLDRTMDDADLQRPTIPPLSPRAPATAIGETVPTRREWNDAKTKAATDSEPKKGLALGLFAGSVVAIALVFGALVYFRGLFDATKAHSGTTATTSDDPKPVSPSLDSSGQGLAPLRPITSPPLVSTPSHTASAPDGTTRIKIQLSRAPLAPTAGQSVQFAATVIGADPRTVSGAHFVVQGAAVNTKLPATLEGNVYRASLTFFDAGSYTVVFRGSAEARDVASSMGMSVSGGAAPLPSPSILPPPQPATSGTVRWL